MQLLCVLILTGVLVPWGAESLGIGNRKKDKDDDKEYTDMEETLGDSSEDFPQQLQVNFKVKGKPVELRLRKNMRMNMDVPIVVGKGSDLTKRMMHGAMDEEMGVYMDETSGASIIVSNRHGKKEYRGTFIMDREEYYLEPMSDSMVAERKRHGRGRDHDDSEEEGYVDDEEVMDEESLAYNLTYVVTEMKEEDDMDSATYESVPVPDDHTPVRATKSDENDVQPLTGAYTVEILVVIDFSTYRKWLTFSEGNTDEEKETNAMRNIQFFYTQIINGVAMRYQSINEDDIKMDATLTGFYIATDVDAAPFTRDNTIIRTPRNFVNADLAMRAMQDWLALHRNELPAFDQATLYVDDYLSGLTGNGILGLATISGLCSKYSTAVSRDLNHYSSAQTTAHELGHNVGGLHDENDNSCLAADQYIMAPYPVTLSADNFFNPFKFSPCTIAEFRDFIAYMDRYNYNCIKDAADPLPNTTHILSTLPGQEYTPDAQCQLVYGQGAYYCGGATEDANICFYMECYDPVSRRCVVNAEQRAAPGTTCGNKKWCESGVCTYNSAAPEALDYCTYGDYKGSYTDGKSCEIGNEQTWLCYSDYYRDDCCQTCAELRNDEYPECLYGDGVESCSKVTSEDCKQTDISELCCETCRDVEGGEEPEEECVDTVSWCSVYVTQASLCYSVKDRCCATCETWKLTDTHGCEFGDRYSNCASNFPGQCYTNEDNCCLTCSKLKDTDAVGCEYGDSESWCSGVPSTQCYTETRCCHTCGSYETGISGCQYGDKISGCSTQDCSDPIRREQCCNTCHNDDEGVISTTTTTKPSTTTTQSGTEDCTDFSWCSTYVDEANKCYSPSVEQSCCQRCKSLKQSDSPGCEYGDRAPWCSDVYNNPGNCYTENTYHSCCDTCNQLRDHTAVGCEYGDTADWCMTLTRTQCYDEDDRCCKTCALHYTGITGCEYGDRITGCSSMDCTDPGRKEKCCYTCQNTEQDSTTSTTRKPTTDSDVTTKISATSTMASCIDALDWCKTLAPSRCYQDGDTCCAKCRPHYDSSKVGCEFGDKAYWCEGIALRKCYLGDYKENCCDTCAQTVTNIVGCEYGDKIQGCSNKDCTDSYVKERCCQTCAQSSPTTTTRRPATTTLSTVLSSSTTTPTVDPSCTDSQPFCSEVEASDCYIVSDVCCHTCKRLETGVKGCVYGNQYDWCSEMHCSLPDLRDKCCGSCWQNPPSTGCEDKDPSCAVLDTGHCYKEITREVCCQTCALASTGQTGCEWGDISDSCIEITDQCGDSLATSACCDTCSNVLSKSGPSG